MWSQNVPSAVPKIAPSRMRILGQPMANAVACCFGKIRIKCDMRHDVIWCDMENSQHNWSWFILVSVQMFFCLGTNIRMKKHFSQTRTKKDASSANTQVSSYKEHSGWKEHSAPPFDRKREKGRSSMFAHSSCGLAQGPWAHGLSLPHHILEHSCLQCPQNSWPCPYALGIQMQDVARKQIRRALEVPSRSVQSCTHLKYLGISWNGIVHRWSIPVLEGQVKKCVAVVLGLMDHSWRRGQSASALPLERSWGWKLMETDTALRFQH